MENPFLQKSKASMTLHVCRFPKFKTSKKKRSEKKAHNEHTILMFTNETFITFKLLKAALALRKSKVTLLNVERLYGLFCANSKHYINEDYWVESLTNQSTKLKYISKAMV